jgi:hypothetical protein
VARPTSAVAGEQLMEWAAGALRIGEPQTATRKGPERVHPWVSWQREIAAARNMGEQIGRGGSRLPPIPAEMSNKAARSGDTNA